MLLDYINHKIILKVFSKDPVKVKKYEEYLAQENKSGEDSMEQEGDLDGDAEFVVKEPQPWIIE